MRYICFETLCLAFYNTQYQHFEHKNCISIFGNGAYYGLD
jgi:hypothetical protein